MIHRLLATAQFPTSASTIQDAFGTIAPPISTVPSDPRQAIPKLLSTGILLFIIFSSFMVLLYLLWGAYDWIVSGGNKEAVTKAQNKIMNAVIGIVLVVVSLTVFEVITHNVLGLEIFNGDWTSWIEFPHL